MKKLNVLILGSGAREHALGWKIMQSPQCGSLYFAPGNGGSADIGVNVSMKPDDFKAVYRFCAENNISLLLPGSEDPLVKGIYDFFVSNPIEGLRVLGPSKSGAQLEGSKHFAKEFMKEFNIPTAAYRSFSASQIDEALAYLDSAEGPYVLKADGLAAGKGVIIVNDRSEAKNELTEMLGGRFGSASQTVVIEQFLQGIEVSFFVLTDGQGYVILPEAKDYKRIGDGDTGPNTGGMGAVSPVPFVNEDFKNKVEERIVQPTISGLRQRGIDYKGFIFIGLMNVGGDPYVIEYNVRMGDPETQIVMMRLETDLLELLDAVFEAKISQMKVSNHSGSGVCITLASEGYPGNIEKGKAISISSVAGTQIFHAGTHRHNEVLLTNGGRVISACALGNDLETAKALAYQAADNIHFNGKTCRTDIGNDLLQYTVKA